MTAKNITNIISKEIYSFFATPVGYVLLVSFWIITAAFTLYLGAFFENNIASLDAFFIWHPWMYLFIIPAITMRVWAEEIKSGTNELLFGLPLAKTDIVIGKFLSVWLIMFLALAGTFPIWLVVNYLGNPDNGIIISGYLASLMIAAVYIVIGICISAITNNQIIAFIVSLAISFAITISGFPMVIEFFSGFMPDKLLHTISKMSILHNYYDISKGIINFSHIVWFISFLFSGLLINYMIIKRNI